MKKVIAAFALFVVLAGGSEWLVARIVVDHLVRHATPMPDAGPVRIGNVYPNYEAHQSPYDASVGTYSPAVSNVGAALDQLSGRSSGGGFAPDAGDVACDGGTCEVVSISGNAGTAGTIPFRQAVLQMQVDAAAPLGGLSRVSMVSESPINEDAGTQPPWSFINGSTNIGSGVGGNVGLLGGFAVADAGALSGASALCTWNNAGTIICPVSLSPSGSFGQFSLSGIGNGTGDNCLGVHADHTVFSYNGACGNPGASIYLTPFTAPALVGGSCSGATPSCGTYTGVNFATNTSAVDDRGSLLFQDPGQTSANSRRLLLQTAPAAPYKFTLMMLPDMFVDTSHVTAVGIAIQDAGGKFVEVLLANQSNTVTLIIDKYNNPTTQPASPTYFSAVASSLGSFGVWMQIENDSTNLHYRVSGSIPKANGALIEEYVSTTVGDFLGAGPYSVGLVEQGISTTASAIAAIRAYSWLAQ